MAALAQEIPSSAVAFTGSQLLLQSDDSASNSAALTSPQKREIVVPARRSTFRISVTNNGPTPIRAIPNWVEPTIAAFIEIRNLSENWDSYGGKMIDRDLINRSLYVLGTAMQANSPAPSIVPLSDGGLQIEWHRRQQDLEITFAADEPAQFFYRNRADNTSDEGSAHETEKIIRLIKNLV